MGLYWMVDSITALKDSFIRHIVVAPLAWRHEGAMGYVISSILVWRTAWGASQVLH